MDCSRNRSHTCLDTSSPLGSCHTRSQRIERKKSRIPSRDHSKTDPSSMSCSSARKSCRSIGNRCTGGDSTSHTRSRLPLLRIHPRNTDARGCLHRPHNRQPPDPIRRAGAQAPQAGYSSPSGPSWPPEEWPSGACAGKAHQALRVSCCSNQSTCRFPLLWRARAHLFGQMPRPARVRRDGRSIQSLTLVPFGMDDPGDGSPLKLPHRRAESEHGSPASPSPWPPLRVAEVTWHTWLLCSVKTGANTLPSCVMRP